MLAQVPLVLGFGCYFANNLYLWSLCIDQQTLLFVSVPLGFAYFIVFVWYIVRTTSNKD